MEESQKDKKTESQEEAVPIGEKTVTETKTINNSQNPADSKLS